MADDGSKDSQSGAVTADEAWEHLRALSDRAKSGEALSQGLLSDDAPERAPCTVDLDAPRGWAAAKRPVSAAAASMFDLYMPLCVGPDANEMTAAHLGQSLDGRIATASGVSQFITGEENLLHTHRMRALFDAVVVGAHTAKHDSPRLTTRRANGEHPTRVLIDPSCSAAKDAPMFVDGMTETLVICSADHSHGETRVPHLRVAAKDGLFAPADILAALRARGLRRIFIEGGGVTVSKFLSAGCLDRLHICVAPMIIGSGRPAVALPEVSELKDSHFLDVTHFPSGKDMLFDCQLRGRQ